LSELEQLITKKISSVLEGFFVFLGRFLISTLILLQSSYYEKYKATWLHSC